VPDNDRSVLVTGGTGGLGAAVTTALLADGWRVTVPWFVEAELTRLPDHDRLSLVQADLSDPDSVGAAVAAAASHDDAPLGAVVNLVGGFAAGPKVHETSLEDFESQFALNVRPTFLVTRAALPHLLDNDPPTRGSIVCVGTRAALEPFPGGAAYAASKSAVMTFVKAVAKEYLAEGVRCNAILPSVIDTPANRESMPKADFEKWPKAAEIAETVRFLCADASKLTSGAWVPVYGRG
jgi:NAD(P)-dependent dehydrogenase (short-subunit alcohol dehydrogenase family)